MTSAEHGRIARRPHPGMLRVVRDGETTALQLAPGMEILLRSDDHRFSSDRYLERLASLATTARDVIAPPAAPPRPGCPWWCTTDHGDDHPGGPLVHLHLVLDVSRLAVNVLVRRTDPEAGEPGVCEVVLAERLGGDPLSLGPLQARLLAQVLRAMGGAPAEVVAAALITAADVIGTPAGEGEVAP